MTRYSIYEEALVPAADLPNHVGWTIQGAIDHHGNIAQGVIVESKDPTFKPVDMPGHVHVLLLTLASGKKHAYSFYFRTDDIFRDGPIMVRIGKSIEVTEDEFIRHQKQQALG